VNILITGGTGLIGSQLTSLLLQKGYQVSYLSRSSKSIPGLRTYQWDIDKGYLDPEAIRNATYIVHLAGAGIADEPWTEARKQEILNSRTRSAALLKDYLLKTPHQVKAFVSASGIGYYGADSGEEWMREDAPAGTDFLAQVCRVWEQAAKELEEQTHIRTTMLRIGIVLSDKGGALPKLVQPIRMGAGSALGRGEQVMSWIHLDDLCAMFLYALESESVKGPYNAVAPHPVTNAQLTKEAAAVLGRWVLPFNVPTFGLRLVFGELTDAIVSNNKVSADKIAATGFNWKYTQLRSALDDLLK
jgi:uncharacterized protein (TIGR01777 family)